MLLDKSLQNAGGRWCRTNESVLQCSLAVLLQYCHSQVETHGSSLLSPQPSPALHYQKLDHPKEKYPVAFFVINLGPIGMRQERLRDSPFKPRYWKGDQCPCNFQGNCMFPFMRSCLLISQIHRGCTGSSSLLQRSPLCEARPGLLLPVLLKTFLDTTARAAELYFVNL